MRPAWFRDPVALVVDTLAAARLTRLVTDDTWPPAVAARTAAIRWADRHTPRWSHGIDCPWCMSPWIAAALVAGHQVADRRGHRNGWALAALPLAISTIVGHLAEWEST
ncbi:MAG: DUF1360 domain-containing protein [Pseudonocardia sp.]|nr:DUF1360 domain-containing protein [Pseudonocardia sp.]